MVQVLKNTSLCGNTFLDGFVNVSVVYMARDVIILMRANPFRGPLERVGPENRDFWALNAVLRIH
jgi:hypothetical protein